MANYDKATEEFITKISGEPPKKEEHEEHLRDALKPLRVAKQVVRVLENPQQNIGRAIVRAATKELMEKSSSMKILAVYQFMNDHYNREWWDWEPETIWTMLKEDDLDETPPALREVIMALQLCVNSMAPFEHWHIFEKVGHAFNHNHVDFSILQPLEPNEAALAMALLRRLQPKSVFDDEVLTYVAVCAKSAGMVWLPEDLCPGVQPKLDEITFEFGLRDATKKAWEDKVLPADELLRSQVEVQLPRLQDVKDLVDRGL